MRGAYLCGEELVYEVYFEEVEENGILSARKEIPDDLQMTVTDVLSTLKEHNKNQ